MGIPTEDESFLLQSMALIECLVKLGEIERSVGEESNLLKRMAYGYTSKKLTELQPNLSIFQGQGVLLSAFYLLLVFPQELKNRKCGDFDKIDTSKADEIAKNNIQNDSTTYKTAKPILQHFRNSLSHGRFGWENGLFVLRDENPRNKNEVFKGYFSMESLGKIVHELNISVHNYVTDVISKRKS